MTYYVNSGSGALRSLSAGNEDRATVNRMGFTVTVDMFQHLAMEGRMYRLSNAVRQTALAVGGTSFSDTAPAFSMDIPTGTVMIPNLVRLQQGGTVAGGVITAIIAPDSATRFSSGGTAQTSRNLRDDAPRVSALTNVLSGATLSAFTTAWTEWAGILDIDVATDPNRYETKLEWPTPGEVAPILVGPAALVVYTFAATTQPSWFFHFKWAEIPTENLY